jgi:hypothetical protein
MDATEVAHRWFDELRAGDVRTAWSMMTDNFRTCVAQATMTSLHQSGQPVDDLLARMERATLEESQMAREFLHSARSTLLEVLTPDIVRADVAPASRPRPLSPGLELVPLVMVDDTDEHGEIPSGASARAARILVEDGEAVAGLDCLLSPGWPPIEVFRPPTDE